MKRIITIGVIVILFASCTGLLSKKDAFIGEWEPIEKGRQEIYLKIIKGDLFYEVHTFVDGKEVASNFGPMPEMQTDLDKQMFKYQLSSDKRFLFNTVIPTFTYVYNEDNNTLTSPFGWYKKK